MNTEKKEIYETPTMDVIEFELEDSIAASSNSGSGMTCGNEDMGMGGF
ncbi:hypothetical protein HF295_02870 [Hujiaoplasma nucleasis]|uniref:Uncharacterized protein n=1 Tax=Hujiaoplasma nucleasis TaxID=2725268 RepID=A0A7L6N3P2_9MOLU|nr:hypothetical protein [Hujiaoplasma nucleasis]QLY39857.1 hypothetical protein HF295_02870 [Hujiaoplasma nucleasis]